MGSADPICLLTDVKACCLLCAMVRLVWFAVGVVLCVGWIGYNDKEEFAIS